MGIDRRYIMRRKIQEPRIVEDIEVSDVTIDDFVEEVEKEQEDEKVKKFEKEAVTKIISEEDLMDERVICVNTGEIYKDNKEASEKTGINAGSIKRCCNGDTKSAGKDEEGNKLVWKYVRDL